MWTSSSRPASSTRSAALLAAGVPPDARPFGGLVYRQAMEHLRGVRDEAQRATHRAENRRYARRQLIWFRKEPNLMWFDGPGKRRSADSVIRAAAWDLLKDRRPCRRYRSEDRSTQYSGRLPELRPPRKLPVTVHLLDGREFEVRIKNFDRFALIVDHGARTT